MSVFKRLEGGSHNVAPIQVHASQSFTWISGSSSNDVGISINLAKKPPSDYPAAIYGLGGETAGGFYSYPLWESLEHLFFNDVSGSILNTSSLYLEIDPASNSGTTFSTNPGQGTSLDLASDVLINAVSFKFIRNGTPSGSAIVRVYSGSTHVPNFGAGQITESERIEASSISNSIFEWITFQLNDDVLVSSTQNIAFFVEHTASSGANALFMETELSDVDSRIRRIRSIENPPTGSWTSPASQDVSVRFHSPLNIFQNFFLNNDVYVINIGSGYYGDHIKTSSFKISIGNNYIVDNGLGDLIDQDSNKHGSIFYKHGIAVIQKRTENTASGIYSNGMILDSGSTANISFNSTVTIYEHTINCKLSPTEYQYTFNPSVFQEGTGSIKYNDLIVSGSQTPYITTVGLYNDFNELLAVAKVSKPVTRMKYTDQTFVVKFDE